MMRSLGCSLSLLATLSACSSDSDAARTSPSPSQTVVTRTPDGDARLMADRAVEAMAALGQSPDSQTLQQEFQDLFLEVYSREWPATTSGEVTTVYGEMLLLADRYAQEGDALFLESIMRASVGPYGRTVEGSEWLAEILWDNLERNPTMTVNVGIENAEWDWLLENVYTRPPHDGYDFARIAEALDVRWEEDVLEDVRRILEAVAPFI